MRIDMISAREIIRRRTLHLLESSSKALTTREIFEALRIEWAESRELTQRLVYNSIVDDPRFVRVASSTWKINPRVQGRG